MDRPPIDLARPPFPFVLTPSPAHAAEQLVSAFHAVGEVADRVRWVHEAISAEMGAPIDAADRSLLAAGRSIAAAADADPVFNDRHAYHNRQHLCEVMLTTHFLCRWHALPPRESRLALLAALIHDLEHDGVPAAPFVYERRSVVHAMPHLAAAGVEARTVAALAALVLATDPRLGTAAAVAARRGHLLGTPVSGGIDGASELDLLQNDAGLAHAAVLLCEADILPSVGLTPEHAARLQQRLAAEWRCRLGRADKLRFLDDVLQADVIGAFFLPNVHALRRALAEPDHAAPR